MFVRITSITSIFVSILCHAGIGCSILWQSGQTKAWDNSRRFNLQKFQWYIKSAVPAFLARKLCQRFATGPEPMVDYYADEYGVNRQKCVCLYNDIKIKALSSQEELLKVSADLGIKFTGPRPVAVVLQNFSPVRGAVPYFEALFRKCVQVRFARDS